MFIAVSGVLFLVAGAALFAKSWRWRNEKYPDTEREKSEQAKTQFVSIVAHQLRAPMTQLRWLTEEMMRKTKLPKDVRLMLEEMLRIVVAENQLVGDLLNVSRIERGVLKTTITKVSVHDLLQETVEHLRRIAAERNVRLDIVDMPKSVRVRADREKAVEAIRNIIDNAIKFSPSGGTVQVNVAPANELVTVSISNEGAEIPEEIWDTLFEVKYSTASMGTSSGAGLGLYLTKKFLEAMNGSVRFETSSKETTFFVTLPRATSGE